jgi:hypothetical protein
MKVHLFCGLLSPLLLLAKLANGPLQTSALAFPDAQYGGSAHRPQMGNDKRHRTSFPETNTAMLVRMLGRLCGLALMFSLAQAGFQLLL